MHMTRCWIVARVRDIRAEFAGEGIDVDGNECKWRGWVRERRVVNGEEVGRKDGRGAIEDRELVSFREMTGAARRGLCDVECVAQSPERK
jgi:hypothetical protein